MRKVLPSSLVCAAMLFSCCELARAQDASPSPSEPADVPQVTQAEPMSFWMAKKLELSKSILQDLTMGDFDELAKDARQMQLLGRIEGFVRRKNPDYRAQLENFEMANRGLIRQAQQRNSAGAVAAFNRLTTSCVACHTLLREDLEAKPAAVPASLK